MKLDTCRTFHQIHKGNGKNFAEQLFGILKHTVSRDAAAVWAQNLRFVAVPEEFGIRRASSKRTTTIVVKKEEDVDFLRTDAADDNDNIHSDCVCDQWPIFPTQELPYLSLTDIGDVQNCTHHVAVSYCWSRAGSGRCGSSISGTLTAIDVEERKLRPRKRQRLNRRSSGSATKTPYDIKTGKGMRSGRVPRDLMDRALRYAANEGLSFIWIDQECIEQDDPVKKELAIQSMHLVYRSSGFPLGLLTANLVHQQHLDALNFAIRYSSGELCLRDIDAKREGFTGTLGRESPIHSFIRNLAEVLKVMARDRWFTRGWIMQEMVLAGEKMVFSIPCDPSLTKPNWAGNVEGELHFRLDQLVPIFDDVLSSDMKARQFNEAIATMDPRLDVGQAFYASYRKLRHITLGTNADGDTSMNGHYRVCNPLAAILYLEGRSNSRHGDRLAIVANLCDYAVRLNSTTLEKLGFGYSTCLLALMLSNGDISYMVEWAKSRTQRKHGADIVQQQPPSRDLKWHPPATYSWMPTPADSLSLGLNYNQFIDNGNLALATIMNPIMQVVDAYICRCGLHLFGWTWRVSEKLDLHDFQMTLKKRWPSILEKAENLDDFASLAAPTANLVLDLVSTILKAGVRDLTQLLWHHLVLDYLGDWSETDDNPITNSRLPKALTKSLPKLRHILSVLAPGYRDPRKTSPSPQLFLRLFLRRLEERSTAPPELEWILNMIIENGCLRWGRALAQPGSCSHETQSGTIAVFACDSKDTILTPQMRDPTKNATERRLWMRHFRQQPGSWIVEHQDNNIAAENNAPIFKTRGMVRGLWKISDAKPNHYVLS